MKAPAAVKELQRTAGRHRPRTDHEQGPGRPRWRRAAFLLAIYAPLLVAAVLFLWQSSKSTTESAIKHTRRQRVLKEDSDMPEQFQGLDVEPADDLLPPRWEEDGGCQKLLWLTGIAGSTAPDRVRYLQVALLSAQRHAPSLVPVLVYGGESDALTRWFMENGGHVVHHTLSFMDEFEAQEDEQWRERLVKGQGIYLRLDIPEILPKILQGATIDMTNVSSRYVLYTDVDVMFVGGGDISTCTQEPPQVLSLGPENVRGRAKNTGVLLMNVPAFAAEWPAMLAYGRERKFNFSIAMDQGLVLAYMNETNQPIGLLPDTYNWKGYYGIDPDVRIFHFHGPKPNRCLPCYLQHRGRPFWLECQDYPGRYPIGCSKNHMQLLRASPDRQGEYYSQMVRLFWQLADAAGSPLDMGNDSVTLGQRAPAAAAAAEATRRKADAAAAVAAAREQARQQRVRQRLKQQRIHRPRQAASRVDTLSEK